MNRAPFAPVLVKLLKGPLYADDKSAWDLLLRHRSQIDAYFFEIGLELILAEADELAFLRRRRYEPGEALSAPDGQGEADDDLPELVTRRELPYLASLLCVLLLEELYRFEAASSGESRLVLTRDRIRDIVSPYMARKSNEAKQSDAIDAQINRLTQYGFLRPLRSGSDELEVMRLLKYKLSPELLAETVTRLKSYGGQADE